MRIARWSLLVVALGILSWGGTLLAQAFYMNGKAVLAQVLLNNAWETTKQTGQVTKAWDWADTWPVAKLTFPRLDENVIVLAGVSGEALAFGPGHVASTAKPGSPGLSVVAAHRDTHFSVLRHARIGDDVLVDTADGKTHTYQIEEARIVDARASGLFQSGEGKTIALVTCFPFDETERGHLRYVMIARSVPQQASMPATLVSAR